MSSDVLKFFGKKEKKFIRRTPVRDIHYRTMKVVIGYEGIREDDGHRALHEMIELIESLEVRMPLRYSFIESVKKEANNNE